MARKSYPPIAPGTHVRTTQVNLSKLKEWTNEALAQRKWGIKGKVIGHHDSHGLCYDVLHEDGTEGCYDPSELAIIPMECMTNKVQPIKPSEVVQIKKEAMPDVVLQSFNELITENFDGTSAVVKQDDVVNLLVKKGFTRDEIFKKGWLEVEDIYRVAGWTVIYDKPGYNEDYDANFEFRKK
ncbi:MAG: hypothetical protein AAB389_01455 [Patescibacteria group bacterium]